MRRTIYVATSVFCFVLGVAAQAQKFDTSQDDGALGVGVFGAGKSTGGAGGAYLGAYTTGRLFGPGFAVELGGAHNLVGPHTEGFFGVSFQNTFNLTKYHFNPNPIRGRFHPFVDVGYTGFFSSGNSLHYGGGLLWNYRSVDEGYQTLRFEYREYYFPSGGTRSSTFRISHEWGANSF